LAVVWLCIFRVLDIVLFDWDIVLFSLDIVLFSLDIVLFTFDIALFTCDIVVFGFDPACSDDRECLINCVKSPSRNHVFPIPSYRIYYKADIDHYFNNLFEKR